MLSRRQELALEFVDLTGRGLEIGPSYEPLAPKSQGFDVTVLDHAPADELRKKYAGYGMDEARLDQIEEVDCVWTGEKYSETPGLKPPYDFVIASHVIEHTLDPVAFLTELSELLTENGRIALVVPDKRFCFDHHRPVSSAGAILDAHLHPTSNHTPGAVLDYFSYHVGFGGEFVWSTGMSGDFYRHHSTERGVLEAKGAMDTLEYMDIHRWVFTPSSLQFILATLSQGGWLDQHVVGQQPTAGCEFFVTLGRGRDERDDDVLFSLLHEALLEETTTNVEQLRLELPPSEPPAPPVAPAATEPVWAQWVRRYAAALRRRWP
jgi:hypothetical protein